MAQDSGVPGRDEVKNKRWGVAPSLAFGLGTRDPRLPRLPARQAGQRARRRRADHRPARLQHARIRTRPQHRARAPTVDPSNFYGTDADYDDVTADMFTVRIEHDFADDVRAAQHHALRPHRSRTTC